MTLLRDWERLEDGERRRFVAIIDRQAGRQLRLVEDVLMMARLLRGSLTAQPEQIEIDRVVAEVIEALPFEVELDIPAPVAAMVDPHHLERILVNLLVNADRYGAPPIIVRAHPTTNAARIEVIDHGTGIAGRLDERLLEPFVQGHSGDLSQLRGCRPRPHTVPRPARTQPRIARVRTDRRRRRNPPGHTPDEAAPVLSSPSRQRCTHGAAGRSR